MSSVFRYPGTDQWLVVWLFVPWRWVGVFGVVVWTTNIFNLQISDI